MSSAVVISGSEGAAPVQTYKLAPTQTLEPLAVSAVFDGTGAGTDFLPTVAMYANNGKLLGRFQSSVAVTAGASSEVTFYPFAPPASSTTPAASGALTLIQKAVLAAPGTFSFTGFPATFNDLILVMILRSTVAATVDQVNLNVNGDGANRYSSEYVRGNSINVTAAGANPSPQAFIGFIPGATGDANEYGFVETTFRGYSDTTHNRFKGGNSVSYCSRGAASFPDTFQSGWDYIQTSAITSIQITQSSAANFTAGSEARLYGLL